MSEHQCHNPNNDNKNSIDLEQNIDLISDDNTSTTGSIRYGQYQRRQEQVSSKMNRRATFKVFLVGVLSSNVLLDMNQQRQQAAASTGEKATTTTILSMHEDIHEAFQIVRNEISDSNNGGIPILQKYLNQREYSNILEFTKLYDQILRKEKIGRAKKLFLNYIKEVEEEFAEGKDTTSNKNLKKKYSERITTISNAITFDLIGMNRSARKQPSSSSSSSSSSSMTSNETDESNKNVDQAIQKYLNLLQSDVEQFLQLEQEIP